MDPSFELEIEVNGKWLEILGCGLFRAPILHRAQPSLKAKAWAAGMGIERIAMIKYSVPDIRMFWSKNQEFLDQFRYEDCNGDQDGLGWSPHFLLIEL
ncbi:hypothetical protein ACOME3_003754 [Neoechinorhynchus agilis]